MLKLFFTLFPYLVYIPHCTKFTHGSSLLNYGKIFAHEKIKSGRKSLVKKRKKEAQRRKKNYHSDKKRKNSFVKATGPSRTPCWRPDFKQRSRC